jgi:DNA-binding NarL/FixJ family response regulator
MHDPVETLTPRQREVLQLVAEGFSTKEIARRLHLSTKTVESHRSDLMQRLDIHGIAGLVRYAIRVGIVALGS